ncbi:MAG: bifunctional indole-3-glycerol-phosphate synthase TrpC/phosphoribosylanthranilate isomerase TrpF, partial [Allosphingosinicella sp.]
VLGEIVARKRIDVAARLGGTSLADLRDRAQPTARRLGLRLAKPGARFIMEVKRASPSEGSLRAGADPAAQARAYAGSADAISVLTDTPFFGGSLADLAAVRRVYDGPILAKDFIVDPRQVAEARLAGADAVLVMLSVLDDAEAAVIMAEADRLGMDVLVEAHDKTEVCRAVALEASVIGINNRDLKSLRVDLGTTERLAGLVPDDRLVVAESGISGREDVERLARFADAFLVGSSLMRADEPVLAARALVHGRVKVCGLRSVEDVEAASANGASFAGLVMVPGTPRAVSRAEAEPLAAAARATGAAAVGVFRNEKVDEVALAAMALQLAAVQLHGEEDAFYIKGLRALLPEGTEIWATGAVGEAMPEPRLGADRTLFDTRVDGRCGGTGSAFDWTRLRGRAELDKAVLAGGITSANARAAAAVGAWALDTCTGVEAAPGRKDPAKLAAFFGALRPTARGEVLPC